LTELRTAIAHLVCPVVAEHGAELVDVEVAGSGSSRVVRLLVHRHPAVTVGLCEAISREVGDLLDGEDLVPGRYRLEVTSPGLGRPLRTDDDFRRAAGRQLKLVLRDGRSCSGTLVAWDSETIVLAPQGRPVDETRVQRDEIARATIVPEWPGRATKNRGHE